MSGVDETKWMDVCMGERDPRVVGVGTSVPRVRGIVRWDDIEEEKDSTDEGSLHVPIYRFIQKHYMALLSIFPQLGIGNLCEHCFIQKYRGAKKSCVKHS